MDTGMFEKYYWNTQSGANNSSAITIQCPICGLTFVLVKGKENTVCRHIKAEMEKKHD